jgi:hypothetical protein
VTDSPIDNKTLDEIRDTHSYTDKLTLDEIRKNHGNMFADLTKDFKHYNFGQKMDSCVKFMGLAMDNSLNHLGVFIPKIKNKLSAVSEKIYENKVQRALDINHVRVERHNKMHEEKDAWMNGMYIYKDDVLLYFISEPMTITPSQFAADPNKSFCIITNAKV